MTDSGYNSLQARSPSLDLKSQLLSADWSFYEWDSGQIAVVDLSWEGHLEPFAMVNFLRPCWKFFWRSKDSHEIIVGLGSLLRLDTQGMVRERGLKGLRFFGGLSFPGSNFNSEWQEFGKEFFILPEIEWRFDKDAKSLQLRLKVEPGDTRQSLLQRFTKLYRDYLTATLSHADTELGEVIEEHHLPNHNAWVSMIEESVASIRQGLSQKLVLSRAKDLKLNRMIDVGLVLKKLSLLNEGSYLFSFVAPSGKAFIGRSPERLLSWQNNDVYVEAIAGTRKRSEGVSEDFADGRDLRSSQKDLVEHRFVTEFVENTLNQFCTDVELLESEQLLRLKNVQHMRSKFRALVPGGMMPVALLNALHPTPAVGGCPRDYAMSYINSHEPFSRGLFAGAVGYTNGVSGDFAIGIRSALISDQNIRLFAGAGIVEKSDPEAEWLETEIKMKNFLDIFSVETNSHEHSKSEY